MPTLTALLMLLAQVGPPAPETRDREVQLIVPRRDCRAIADNSPVALDALPDRAKAWRIEGRPVRFRAEPFAPYECVDQVLRTLRDAGVTIRATGADPVRDVGSSR